MGDRRNSRQWDAEICCDVFGKISLNFLRTNYWKEKWENEMDVLGINFVEMVLFSETDLSHKCNYLVVLYSKPLKIFLYILMLIQYAAEKI